MIHLYDCVVCREVLNEYRNMYEQIIIINTYKHTSTVDTKFVLILVFQTAICKSIYCITGTSKFKPGSV